MKDAGSHACGFETSRVVRSNGKYGMEGTPPSRLPFFE